MKVRVSLISTGENSLSRNERVRVEIHSFLQALNSYPDRFKKDPRITFEKHHSGLVALAQSQPRRRA